MIRSHKHKEYFKAAYFIWAAFVFVVHVIPVGREELDRFDFPFADKWVHGVLFFILANFGYLAAKQRRTVLLTITFVFLECISLGAQLEIIQYLFTDERTGDWFDLLADAVGSLVGLGFAKMLGDRIILRS